MKEYNGILYIVSHNPETKESEIGTFPSPLAVDSELSYTYNLEYPGIEKLINKEINYKPYDFTSENIIYLQNKEKQMVSSIDKYTLNIDSINSIYILDFYAKSNTGNVEKIELNYNSTNNFPISYSSYIGYKFRAPELESCSLIRTYNNVKNYLSLQSKISSEDNIFNDNIKNSIYDLSLNFQCYFTSNETDQIIYLQ
jgi:hypothetical protein